MLSNKIIGNLTTYVIVLLCFAYPISATFSLAVSLPTSLINITYRMICLGLAIAIILIMAAKNTPVKFNIALLPLFIFFLFYSIRLVLDTIIFPVFQVKLLPEIYGYYIGGIIVPIIAVSMASHYVDLCKLTKLSLLALLLTNIMVTYFYLKQHQWIITPEMMLNRAAVTGEDKENEIVNPISFALYGGYLFLLGSSILFLKEPQLPLRYKYFGFLGIFLGLFNMIMGNSRGPMLLCCLCFGLIVYWSVKRIRGNFKNYTKLVIISVGSVVLISWLIGQLDLDLGIFERLIELSDNLNSGQKEERNILYKEALDMFLESPILGKKYVLDSNGDYPHNVVLEILMSMGIFGLFFYFLVVVNLFLAIYNRNKKMNHLSRIAPLVLLAVGISYTSGSIYDNIGSWLLPALFLADKNG